MILHAHWQGHHRSSKPVLVWLHGFLGDAKEWCEVQTHFAHWPQLSLDLPGHGGSCGQRVTDFDDLSRRISATLEHHRVTRYWLIGYSLGGRAALYHACRQRGTAPEGIIVEGAHPGLNDATLRAQRRANDARWADRFRQQPLSETLTAWYDQALFDDLSAQQKSQLVALRLHNHKEALAEMLTATSLARQPSLLPEIQSLAVPFGYLCGEWDHKFQQLAAQAALPCEPVPAAGHNAHRANPHAFAHLVARMLNHA